MSGSRLLVGGLTTIAVFSLICVCTAENKNKTPSNQPPDLLQKIAALETRIAALEKRVEQQAYPAPVASSVYQASGIVPPAPDYLPQGSKQGTINGMPFYIVPISKQGK